MMPIYENINQALDSSFHMATYTHSKTCGTTNWHIHPEYELVYIRNGNGILRIDSHTIPYKDGALIFLGPNIPHLDFGNKEFSDNLEIVIQFKKEFIDEKLSVFPEFKGIRSLIELSGKVLLFDNKFKKRHAKAFEKLKDGNNTQKLINLFSLLEELANSNNYRVIFSDKSLNSHRASDVHRLETIFEFVNEHFDETIHISKLSAHVGLTTNSFCRFFKKMTDKTFVQFVNEFRIRKATELLNETQLSVSEVMYRCGFNDSSYFAKLFKKYTHKTPSNYLLIQ